MTAPTEIYRQVKTPAGNKKDYQSMSGKNYSPIWITSREHLKRFSEVIANASWFRKHILHSFKVPLRFPHIQSAFGNTPLLFECYGELTISKESIKFDSINDSFVYGSRYHKVVGIYGFEFDIKRNEILSLSRYDYPVNAMQLKTINWIVISLNDGAEIILYNSGAGYNDRRTDTLYTLLQMWFAESNIW